VVTGHRAGQAFLSVANTGPVIAPAEVRELFEPFRRRGAGRTNGEGLGLGLSIVRAIAAAHHARLRARALPTGGLSIQLRLPLVGATSVTPTQPVQPIQARPSMPDGVNSMP
jgi:signal transduction histidine kinase